MAILPHPSHQLAPKFRPYFGALAMKLHEVGAYMAVCAT